MRAGTVLIFLVLIVMGFGFLLSNTMYLGQDLATAEAKLAEITKEKVVVDDQLARALVDLENFKRQVELLVQEKLVLTEQLGQTQAQYRLLQEQNDRMRAQIERMEQVELLVARLANIDSNSLMLALMIPLVPISLVGSLLVFRKGRHNEAISKVGTDQSKQRISMYVTKEEMRHIQQIRRHRPG